VLVLNAGVRGQPADGRPRPPTEMADEQWDEVFRVNVLGNYRLIRGFAPRLAAGGVGSVITLLSGSGFIPIEGGICYGSSKAALWQMTKYLAHQEPRIRFNSRRDAGAAVLVLVVCNLAQDFRHPRCELAARP
jgi:NAD(P)-dependent dehydrogenase (short-subunit alcohol dehydrogenase family)